MRHLCNSTLPNATLLYDTLHYTALPYTLIQYNTALGTKSIGDIALLSHSKQVQYNNNYVSLSLFLSLALAHTQVHADAA